MLGSAIVDAVEEAGGIAIATTRSPGKIAALNREAEQQIHFRAAQRLGVSRKELEGMIIHAAHYAGWPVSATAFRVLGEVWPEDEAAE